jgi:hypothetical protein
MRHLSILACACALASISATLPASAGAPYDGKWAVALVTERGACDQAISWSVAVTDSRIQDSGMFVQSAGYVDGRGRVTLQLTHGSDVVAAAGSISGTVATGTWQSPTKQCSGHWRAVRS